MPQQPKTPLTGWPEFHGLSLIGCHPALDFLNTVKYRGADEPEDKLTSSADVISWAQVAGLLSSAEAMHLSHQDNDGAGAARLHREICAFREQVRALFQATDLSGSEHTSAVVRVEAAITSLRRAATINRKTGVLSRHIAIRSLDDLKARIVDAASEVLTERASLRIKVCGGSDCDWLFIDRTRPGRRRWCDTRTCGNIARVRRFRMKT